MPAATDHPDPDLLRAAQEASGLSMQRWIREVLIPACGATPPAERTVYRWLAGEYPIPPRVRALLERGARV